jgi:alpha-amylase
MASRRERLAFGRCSATPISSLEPTSYPTWDKLVALPASTRLEWKCIKVAPNTATVWQGGANNVVTTPASGTVTATASF